MSTFFFDGLIKEGYEVRLVDTAAVEQYGGFKYTDDRHDAYRLARKCRVWHHGPAPDPDHQL